MGPTMDSVQLSVLFLAAMIGAAVAGMALGARLPAHDVGSGSRDAVLRYVGLVVTLAALVLAFVVSSANSYFESVDVELTEVAADVAALDRVLSRYGPEADSARQLLRDSIATAARTVWASDGAAVPAIPGGRGMTSIERLSEVIDALQAKDGRRAALRGQAIEYVTRIQHSGYKLNRIRQARAEGVLLAIIVSWLVIVFLGFGVVTPRTGVAVAAMILAAVAAAGALFLVVELFSPVHGLIRIDPSVLLDALPATGRG